MAGRILWILAWCSIHCSSGSCHWVVDQTTDLDSEAWPGSSWAKSEDGEHRLGYWSAMEGNRKKDSDQKQTDIIRRDLKVKYNWDVYNWSHPSNQQNYAIYKGRRLIRNSYSMIENLYPKEYKFTRSYRNKTRESRRSDTHPSMSIYRIRNKLVVKPHRKSFVSRRGRDVKSSSGLGSRGRPITVSVGMNDILGPGMGGSAVESYEASRLQRFATEPAPQTAVRGSIVVLPCR